MAGDVNLRPTQRDDLRHRAANYNPGAIRTLLTLAR